MAQSIMDNYGNDGLVWTIMTYYDQVYLNIAKYSKVWSNMV